MEVSPFRGIRYNEDTVRDLARVICPPYDVITAEQQGLYYKENDYNAIRLEFPEPTGDRYEKAASTFQKWLENNILRYDSASSFYLHEHRFEWSGEKKVRRGLIARVKLGPWGNGISPHEETSAKAKNDRLQLMRACRASFSPLLSLYQDSEQGIARILSRVTRQAPLMSLEAGRSNLPDCNEAHCLWIVADPETKRELGELLSCQRIYVADGHHRYETALTYEEERGQEQLDSGSPSAGGFHYVMMELVEFSDPGLVVLPLHRLVRGIEGPSVLKLADQLRDLFALEFIPLRDGSWHLPVDSCLGILGLQPGSLVALRKRQGASLEAMMPDGRSQAYKEFGVSILNHIVVDKMLGRAEDLDTAYTVDLQNAHEQIAKGKYQLAFLLNPAQPGMIKAVADAQDRMPSKSTCFYPKVPAGLVISSLD